MVAVSDERGQALVFVVLLIGVAAASVTAIRAAQDMLVENAHVHRAGEAAVEAAAAAVADAYVARGDLSPKGVRALVADVDVVHRARTAANELAHANGAAPIESLALSCDDGRIEAHLELRRYPHRAGFAASECSPR